MEDKFNIGKLVKDRLENAHSSPKEELWNQLNNSLDIRNKNKKQLYYKYITGILAGFLLVALLFIFNYKDTIKTNNNPQNSKQIELLETSNNIPENKQSNLQNTVEKNNTPTNVKTIQKIEKQETELYQNKKKKKKTIPSNNTNISDDGYTVTTTYTYYLSELGITLTANSKEEMDNLVAKAKSHILKKDSISQSKKTNTSQK